MNLKWDRRFLRLAAHVADWSYDPSTKVGAVLVNDDKIVVGMGYNGFPRGMSDDPALYADRDFKYLHVVHAEENACINAGHASRGATLYVWPAFGFPCICSDCCKVAVQSGVKRIVGALDRTLLDSDRVLRWKDSLARSFNMCVAAGVTWSAVEMEENETTGIQGYQDA